MKTVGIVRKIDELGRIVLPAEIRTVLGIAPHDELEILGQDGCVVIRKYEPACVFCGKAEHVSTYCDKTVCDNCRRALGNGKSKAD